MSHARFRGALSALPRDAVLQGAHDDAQRNRSKTMANVDKVYVQPGKRVRHTSFPLRGWLYANFTWFRGRCADMTPPCQLGPASGTSCCRERMMSPHAIAAKKLKMWTKFAYNLANVFPTPRSHCGDGCTRTLPSWFRGRCADTTPPGQVHAGRSHATVHTQHTGFGYCNKEPQFSHFHR